MRPARAISGHVFRVDLKRRSVWRAKYRLPDGRQVQRTIGRVWTERGRPPEGYFTKRTAQAWLRDVLDQAERGVLPGMVRTGRTFADAAEEYLRYLADDRQRKPSTVRDARSVIRNHLLPRFGERPLEDITEQDVERWASRLGADRPLSNATKRKVIVIFHGVMERACRVYRLPMNPVGTVEKPRLAAPGAIDVFSPEEVHALVRAAASEQDAAIFLTAAFTGLRQGELVALRWRDVDFAGSYIRVTASYTNGELSTPKSGRMRSVPMAPEVAEALARLEQRERFVGPDDLVFVGLGRRPPRRVGVAAPLPHRAAGRRPAAAALPRSAPHVRHAGDQLCRYPAGPGVDGPRGRPDDDEIPPLRPAPR
jgi:integrase